MFVSKSKSNGNTCVYLLKIAKKTLVSVRFKRFPLIAIDFSAISPNHCAIQQNGTGAERISQCIIFAASPILLLFMSSHVYEFFLRLKL